MRILTGEFCQTTNTENVFFAKYVSRRDNGDVETFLSLTVYYLGF